MVADEQVGDTDLLETLVCPLDLERAPSSLLYAVLYLPHKLTLRLSRHLAIVSKPEDRPNPTPGGPPFARAAKSRRG